LRTHPYIKHRKANIKHFLADAFIRSARAHSQLPYLFVKGHALQDGASMQCLMMNEMNVLGALICFGCGTAMALEQSATASPAGFEFDHVWIVVARDAPERAALEKAGLKISPDVNRHDGQGTASITSDFQNFTSS
jgi:hypothetical protein